MKLIPFFVCLASMGASSCLGQADGMKLNYEFTLYDEKKYATLDDLSQSLLTDPYVLTEIGLKRSQFEAVSQRDHLFELMKIMLTSQIARAYEMEEDQESLNAEFLKVHGLASGIHLADLDAKQTSKLKKVAMRERPLDALQTKEVSFALGLSPEQANRLQTIQSQFWVQVRRIEKKYAPPQIDMEKLAQTFSVQDESESVLPTIKAVVEFTRQLEDRIRKGLLAMEAPVAEASKLANARALRVLTADQAKRYQQLQK